MLTLSQNRYLRAQGTGVIRDPVVRWSGLGPVFGLVRGQSGLWSHKS
jgi:hypothetical protein